MGETTETKLRGVIGRQEPPALAQTLHAAVILLLPTCATIVAIVLAFEQGVARWEIATLAIMYFLTMAGISLGLHRMLAHRAFEPARLLRAVLAVLGAMAAQGPPIYWAANHRRHHAYTDLPGDLHSPHVDGDRELRGWRGLWHAHIGWTFDHQLTNTAYFGKDLLQDRDLTFVNRHYHLWVMLGLVLPALVGFAIEGSFRGLAGGLLWGGGVRLFLSYHFIATINSVLHVYGYRRFNTKESSRNNLWLALPTLGEGWHNNHHASPGTANFSRVWWEFDPGWQLIRVLRRLGLVRSANDVPTHHRAEDG